MRALTLITLLLISSLLSLFGQNDTTYFNRRGKSVKPGKKYEYKEVTDATGVVTRITKDNNYTTKFKYQSGEIHGKYTEYSHKDSVELIGEYKEGLRVGEWQGFDLDKNLLYTESYLEGKIVLRKASDYSLSLYDSAETKNSNVTGDPQAWINFQRANFKIPAAVYKSGDEGALIYEFLVTTDGKACNINWINKNTAHPLFAQEVLMKTLQFQDFLITYKEGKRIVVRLETRLSFSMNKGN